MLYVRKSFLLLSLKGDNHACEQMAAIFFIVNKVVNRLNYIQKLI
jgi:hypothetical protein